MYLLCSVAVIYLGFQFSTYTVSENTSVSNISIVIENYDDLVINNDIEVTVYTLPQPDNNATEQSTGDGMFSGI